MQDKDFLVTAASIGIKYQKFGDLMLFTDEFITFFKFDFPFEDFKMINYFEKNSCLELIKLLPKLYAQAPDNTTLREALKSTCSAFDNSMEKMSSQIENTALLTLG